MLNFRMPHGDYIVYVDESGDHSLQSIDKNFPVFSLAFCIFKKSDFTDLVVPSIQKLKFEFWGHDAVVFHGHEIRKQHGDFRILVDAKTRASFVAKLNDAIEQAPFTVIASVIDKAAHKRQYTEPRNPYEIALVFCMERLFYFLRDLRQLDKTTFLIVECRGAKEDEKLELEFRRICDGANQAGKMPNFEIRFMDKKHNSTGLQFADLVAQPIARHVIAPDQPNRAYDVIEKKLRKDGKGNAIGYGVKVFP
jgi:hypothetical protein